MAVPAPTVVVIDDEESIRTYLNDVLEMDGYACKTFRESLSALAYLSQSEAPPDLVMTDIRMPGMNGLELLKQVQVIMPGLPVILISGLYEQELAVDAVRSGAADYLLKPAKPAEVLSLVAKHVQRGPSPAQEAIQRALEEFVTNYRTSGTDGSGGAPGPEATELFRLLGFRRYETMQHSMRVAAYAMLLARKLSLSEEELRNLELGALLHDIGKIAIPRNVLLKSSGLTEKEWNVMRTHPRTGHQLLSEIPTLQKAAEVVFSHHERYDGKGYPRGLKGQEIPVGARLFSIVDTVDAITCDRPYRRARPFEAAYSELRRGRGAQFDPYFVDLFLSLPQEELTRIRDRYPDTE